MEKNKGEITLDQIGCKKDSKETNRHCMSLNKGEIRKF